ncbi:MAG TPA: hypothetical protein VJS11_09555 [Acidobacteriaceae bacterium]|nr:hypothetical protein [Acidobacteriaceae bacterium]
MNTSELIAGIDEELSRLRQVRGLLASDGGVRRGPGRPAASFEFGASRPKKKKRHMSAEGRAKIAAAQRKRWAKLKAASK